MAILQWDSTMSVGVEVLDNQHRTLIDLINEAYEVLSTEHLPGEERRFLDVMERYALEHFSLEEQYMQEAGFPGLEEHCREHEMFREQLEVMAQNTASLNRMLDVFVFLSKWLKRHFLEKDREYMSAMKARGL